MCVTRVVQCERREREIGETYVEELEHGRLDAFIVLLGALFDVLKHERQHIFCNGRHCQLHHERFQHWVRLGQDRFLVGLKSDDRRTCT
jgi:hypothetical protein